MVKVYTNYSKVKRDYTELTIVDDNEAFFDAEENGETGIDVVDFELMQIIDNITFHNNLKSTQNTKSPFGPVKMFDLSTGCKAAINLHHSIRDNKQVAINITECGENVVYECFKLADNVDIVLILQHGYITGIPNEFKFLIDGEIETNDIDDLSDYTAEGGIKMQSINFKSKLKGEIYTIKLELRTRITIISDLSGTGKTLVRKMATRETKNIIGYGS